jgi:hypothetical protein
MAPPLRSLRAPTATALLVLTLAACSSSAITPSASVTTLVAGNEHYFNVEWSVVPEGYDTRRISGYVYSKYGEFATDVRLLGQSLDDSGGLVGQRIVWVTGGVPGFGKAYFEIPNLPAAESYRVTVWTYTFQQSPSIIR